MNNVILIGMPGCGKSTIGVILAKSIGFDFIDSDLLIQNRAGKKLHEIIEAKGIEEFLKLEESVNCSISSESTVIATGGSAVYSEKAMEHFRKIGKIIYLTTPKSELERRILNFKTRGIVIPENMSFDALYNERDPLYKENADFCVSTIMGNVEEIVEEIINKLQR